ncbi:MAG: hypothetical protein LV479_03430 [Methylacidiphilales bacterium]|nr:hypothetical protein [Candidatus Methylacidiphilales bacterium]
MPNGSDDSLLERLNEKLSALFAALILAYVIFAGFRPVMDNVDLGWHVAQGRWMVEHSTLYRHDVFNYPNLGHPVIDEYPAFQVPLYLTWSLGWWGPCLLTALIYTAMLVVLLQTARWFNLASSSLLAMTLGLMLLFFQVGALLRPHIITYLAGIIFGCFLLRHRDAKNWIPFWPLAVLQVIWVNGHSGFVLGPVMVGLFGAEMMVRHALSEKSFPAATVRTWTGAFLLVAMACFLTPYGPARLYLPFYQDRLESIRAYVGEMEPLGSGPAAVYQTLALITAVIIGLMALLRRGAISSSFLLLAVFFYTETLSVRKAWPVFGIFAPLLVLSSGAFTSQKTSPRRGGAANLLGNFLMTAVVAAAFFIELDGMSPNSLQVEWRELGRSRSELSIDATSWMKSHQIKGRLFHRCEDGGWLQQEGFDHGEVFSDTGFGKFDEAFIHETGLVNERPAFVPKYLAAYLPDFVVCSTFCYQWPFYLRQNGWRPIFYSPNSSVWTRPETRPDLPSVTDEQIMTSFDRDLAVNGRPTDIRLLGRNLIALNSLGLEDFAFAKLKGLPPEDHRAGWYWEAARFLCFGEPTFSQAHRDELRAEAESLHDDAITAEFRAYYAYASGDIDGALRILEGIPREQMGNYAAELLLKIYLDRKRPEALALARRTDCFDLRNGRHWQYLAEAEEQAGHSDAAARAWKKAVFYYPDDAALMAGATSFAQTYHNSALQQAIGESAGVYGISFSTH